MERELKKIMADVVSHDPEKRFYALDRLYELKQRKNEEIDIPVLINVIETAAKPFPEPVDAWDHPSYYLLDFVSEYQAEDLVEPMMAHFYDFSDSAKRLALHYVCNFEDEKYLMFLEDVFKQELALETDVIIPDNLYDHPHWVRHLFEKYFTDWKKERYQPVFFSFLYYCLRNNLLNRFKSAEVLPLIQAEYRKNKEAYAPYDKDYTRKFAYRSWKDMYFELRDKLVVNLTILGFYYEEQFQAFFTEAMEFKDPMLKTKAVLIALDKNIPVPAETMMVCATDVETSGYFYYELQQMKKEHLFPIKENKQSYFAKSQLFHRLMEDESYERFPTEWNVEKTIELDNYFGQPIRFYLITFTDEEETPFVAWVGSYVLEEENDGLDIWDNSYCEFVEWNSQSVEKHVQDFYDRREKGLKEVEEEIIYESKPKPAAWHQFLALLAAGQWVRVLTKDEVLQGTWIVTILFTALVAYLLGKRAYEAATRNVTIKGRSLVYQKGKERIEVYHHDIKKITINKKKKKQIEVYNHQNELVMSFPSYYVSYLLFSGNMMGQTQHLKEPPYIDQPID